MRVGQKGSIKTSTRDVQSLTLLFIIGLLNNQFKGNSEGVDSGNKLSRLDKCLKPSFIFRAKTLKELKD